MNTAKNTTARKTASQRAQEKVLNGHDASVEDARVKDSEPSGTQYAYQAYCEALGVKQTPAITFKNCIAGFLGSIVAMVFGYAVGMTIVDLLAYGIFLLTGWAYLALAVYIVGMVLTMVTAVYAGGKVAAYIGTGAYTKDMERAGAWIKSKFSFGKSETVAA
jgi:hypothetical protein